MTLLMQALLVVSAVLSLLWLIRDLLADGEFDHIRMYDERDD